MSRFFSVWRRPPVLLGLAVLAFYGILAWVPVFYDDIYYIGQSPAVRGPWPGWAAFFARPLDAFGNYEPGNLLLHRLLYACAGDRPLAYRLSSLLLHWLNAVLAWSLLRRVLREPRWAFWGALLFALFPAHVETLAISSSKKHLCVSLACLAALRLRVSGLHRAWRDGLCWLLFAFGLTFKESGVLLPVLTLLWDRGTSAAPPRGRWAVFAGYAGIFAAYAWWRLRLPGPLKPLLGGDWLTHVAGSATALGWYLSQLAWPGGLCFEHSLRPLALLAGPAGAAGLALGAAAAVLGLARLRRREPALWLGTVWILACLVPFLNLVPFVNESLVADRYLYLASLGAALVYARLGERGASRAARLLPAAAAVLAAAWAAAAVRRAALFASGPVEFWAETARCAPGNARARYFFGDACFRRGLYPEAETQLRRALELNPRQLPSYDDLVGLLLQTQRPREATVVAEARLALAPDATAWHNLGVCRLRAGREAGAREAFREAARLDPGPAGPR
ncbi:MAG: tetratricopeptide repeat protein [Elusimicrobia bacterium]|nr:tetratricopeptide repeat protein [Elusimicrobiota bacterium]